MSAHFPRLLVATIAPNMPGGGGSGAVMRQMLKDWPAKNFLVELFAGSRTALWPGSGRVRVALIPHKFYPHRRWRAQKTWLLETIWVPWAARHFRRTLKLFRPEVVWVFPTTGPSRRWRGFCRRPAWVFTFQSMTMRMRMGRQIAASAGRPCRSGYMRPPPPVTPFASPWWMTCARKPAGKERLRALG